MKQQNTYYINRMLIDNTYDSVIKKWDNKFPMTERQKQEKGYLLFHIVLPIIDNYDADEDIEYDKFMRKIRTACEPYMWRFSPIMEYAHKFYNSFRQRLHCLKYLKNVENGKKEERN